MHWNWITSLSTQLIPSSASPQPASLTKGPAAAVTTTHSATHTESILCVLFCAPTTFVFFTSHLRRQRPSERPTLSLFPLPLVYTITRHSSSCTSPSLPSLQGLRRPRLLPLAHRLNLSLQPSLLVDHHSRNVLATINRPSTDARVTNSSPTAAVNAGRSERFAECKVIA